MPDIVRFFDDYRGLNELCIQNPANTPDFKGY